MNTWLLQFFPFYAQKQFDFTSICNLVWYFWHGKESKSAPKGSRRKINSLLKFMKGWYAEDFHRLNENKDKNICLEMLTFTVTVNMHKIIIIILCSIDITQC